MTNQLLPSPELAAPVMDDATPEQRIAIWLGLLSTGHKLVMAGLARDLKPGEDIRTAYRRWYAEQMAIHDQTVERMLLRLQCARQNDAS